MNEIFIISLMSFVFVSFLLGFQVQMIENRGILITWQSKEPLKEVQILYSPSGKNYYKVAVKRYSFPRENIKDTFLWVFKPVDFKILNKIKEKAKIKLVYITENNNNNNKEEVLSLKDLKLTGSFKIKEKESKVSNSSSFDYGTYPAWPMFQVDPQHTGQYPYAVYPPLQYQWTYTLDYNDFLMISASISSNGVIYVGDGGRFLRAIDIKTGNILWERGLTANVWTTALVNDTLVLAWTSISFDITMPTLFLINAKTGDTVWGRMHSTMEIQPLVVDTLIYVVNPDNAVMVCWTLRGNILWTAKLIDSLIGLGFWGGGGYNNNLVYISGLGKKLILSLDKINGNLYWEFYVSKWVSSLFPLLSQEKVYFFGTDTLYALSQEQGDIKWKKSDFSLSSLPTPSKTDTFIFCTSFGNIYKLHSETGTEIWKIRPVDIGGVTSIIITDNKFLWCAGDNLYCIDAESGNTLLKIKYTDEYESWITSWFWPIFYGNYVLATHKKKLYVYKGFGIPITIPEYEGMFLVTPLINSHIYLYLKIMGAQRIIFKIIDISGRIQEKFDLGVKGSGFIVLTPQKLSKGIYFLTLKTKENFLRTKIVYLKGG